LVSTGQKPCGEMGCHAISIMCIFKTFALYQKYEPLMTDFMRTKSLSFLLISTWFTFNTAVAQQANVNLDWRPHFNAENLTPFSAPLNSPDVKNDHTVTFRLKAPDAKKVNLTGGHILAALGRGREPLPFVKEENGIWTLTVGPLKPDMYVYQFNVDGMNITDPSNTIAAFTGMPPYSYVVVHGESPAYYDAKNVPHGTVTRHIYHSDVTNGTRDLYVYTPPGYDPKKKYPTLYLLGGSGELPSNWMYDGRANLILDNLIAEGKALPMVMVLPNNQIVHRNHPQHADLTFKLFEKELRDHIVPLVEQSYSVRKEPKYRALSGLSMGGRHTMFCGFNSLDIFGNFGVLSAGDNDSEKTLSAFLNDPKVNDKVKYLFVGQGNQEESGTFGARVAGLRKALDNHKINYEYYVGGGMGHDWTTWRHLLYYRFLPNLWRK
jgi:enterochelin esterase-like enzyme